MGEVAATSILDGDVCDSRSIEPVAIHSTDTPEAGETADVDWGEKPIFSELCGEYRCELADVGRLGDDGSFSLNIVPSLAVAESKYS